MSRADITETCGCGATLHVVMDSLAYAQNETKKWRENHRHEPAPPSAPPEDVECCASGRCEVCTPGYVWGRDG